MCGPARNSMPHVLSRCVEDESGCWLWTGAKTGSGYGRLVFDNVARMAHRLVWEYFRAEIPAGLQLDHLCRVRACVNPWHLEPVTPQVNTLRGEGHPPRNAAATHCKWGHPFDQANTYVVPGGKGRQCRTCKQAEDRANGAARQRRRSALKRGVAS